MQTTWTLEQAVEKLSEDRVIALDLETSGFSPWKDQIHVITLYGEKSKTPVILHYPRGRKVPIKVLRWLEEFEEIVTHNGTMFDILFLANAGLDWKKVKWYDTLVGELAVITADRRDIRVNLAASLKRRTGQTIDKTINHESWGNDYLDSDQLRYLHGDISHLLGLRKEQFDRAEGSEDMMRNLVFEQSLVPAVVQMELNGLPISLPKLRSFLALQEEQASRMVKYFEQKFECKILTEAPRRKADIPKEAYLVITSPKQLKDQLQFMFGEKTFPDTTAERFQNYLIFGGELAEVCQSVLDFRHADRREKMYSSKFVQDYVVNHDGLNATRLHGKFWQIGTNTGRFSSSQPNLQQVPRDMRAVFEAPEGRLIGATDYSGIEVRVAAALAEDEVMIQAFREGQDIHTIVGAAGFGIPPEMVTKEQRQIAKAMSFTLLFGGGAETFRAYASARGSTISEEDAELAVERFFDRFDGIKRMRQSAVWQAQNMRAVTLRFPTGLKRVLFNQDLKSSTILNNIVQGTAAAGLKYGLKLCWDDGLTDYISALVHDEIVYTAPAHMIVEVRDAIEQRMIDGMLEALKDAVPIPIEVESQYGQSWSGNPETTHTRVGGGTLVGV